MFKKILKLFNKNKKEEESVVTVQEDENDDFELLARRETMVSLRSRVFTTDDDGYVEQVKMYKSMNKKKRKKI